MGLLTLPFIAVLALVFYPVLTSGGWLWLATWNAVPVILAFAVFFSVFRRSAIAARASGYAFALTRVASIAPSSQMLCLRVSGIRKIAIRNITAGTAMG